MNKTTIEIQVTQEHIDNGKKGCGDKCAIALAAKDVLNDIHVCSTQIVRGNDNTMVVKELAVLPEEAITFVGNFDSLCGEDSKPFSFQIEIDLDDFDFGITQLLKDSENINVVKKEGEMWEIENPFTKPATA